MSINESKKIRKPNYVSHYLVLKDLLNNVDVREKSDIIFYLTARIENIKCDLKAQGLEFIEDIRKESTYIDYKPYVLVATKENIEKAESLLNQYTTDEVLNFLDEKRRI